MKLSERRRKRAATFAARIPSEASGLTSTAATCNIRGRADRVSGPARSRHTPGRSMRPGANKNRPLFEVSARQTCPKTKSQVSPEVGIRYWDRQHHPQSLPMRACQPCLQAPGAGPTCVHSVSPPPLLAALVGPHHGSLCPGYRRRIIGQVRLPSARAMC